MFIAFLGLPGSGKSTLAKALAVNLDGVPFLEPEEEDWPGFVRDPHPLGDFTRLSWFRSQRVPLYFQANSLSEAGQAAVLDSYYDKWCGGWLGKPGFEWLMEPDDPYLPTALSVAEIDWERLPSADVVIVLEIDEHLWLEQLTRRGRRIDGDDLFLKSHSGEQYLVDTALRRGLKDGTLILRHNRKDIDPRTEAAELRERLASIGLVSAD